MRFFIYTLLVCLIVLLPNHLQAQMFSLNSEKDQTTDNPTIEGYSSFTFSYQSAAFDYKGTNSLRGFEPLGFEGSILSLGYETTNSLIEFTLGSSNTGISNNSDFLSIHFKNLRPLFSFGKSSTKFNIPLGLAIDYTRVTDSRSTLFGNNLNQSGFLAGTALQFFMEKKNWVMLASADAFYGFSFADGSAFRGNTIRANAPIRFMLKNVFNQIDLTVGYTYLFKRIDITNDADERFDYDFSSHQFLIGLRF